MLCAGDACYQLDRQGTAERRLFQLLRERCRLEGKAGAILGICAHGRWAGWLSGMENFVVQCESGFESADTFFFNLFA